MEDVGFILLNDLKGIKFDGIARSALKKLFLGTAPHSYTNVLRGELLLGLNQENYPHFNYVLFNDRNICLFCDEYDVAPLNREEFLLLEATKKPSDRLDTFNKKLEWGVKLKPGADVYISIPGANISSAEQARATVHYKGVVGKLPGINFGVEILKGRHADLGTTDGTFQGKQYFRCADGYGFFAPLHVISPATGVMPSKMQGKVDSSPPRLDPAKETGVVTEKTIRATKFQLGQRVAFFDNKEGAKHYGVVRWTGTESRTKKFPYVVVGIETDEEMFMTDFESSVIGMSHYIPSCPKRRALFLPEASVDELNPSSPLTQAARTECAAQAELEVQTLAKQSKMTPEQVRPQKKAMKEAELAEICRYDKEVIDVLVAAEQAEEYRRLQAESVTKKHSIVDLNQASHNLRADKIGGATIARDDQDSQGVIQHRYEDMGDNHGLPTKHSAGKGTDLHHHMDQAPHEGSIYQQALREQYNFELGIRRLSQQQNAAAGKILELEQNIQKQQLTIQAQQLDIQQKIEQITAKDLAIQRKDEQITAQDLDIERKGEHIADLQQRVKSSDDETRFTQIQSSTGNLQPWNIPRTAVQSIAKHEIGRGAWGVVYSGTFRGERVAIKQAHKDVLHATTIDMLKREVMIMAHIQHPNLVRFIAAVFDEAVERGTDMPIIVSELMDMNLRVAYKEVNLSSFLLSIFCDVAYALHYLHQHRHPIIHRDLSAPNVLLKVLRNGVGYQAKVSDFGSANLVKQAQTAGAGAIVYSAPEMFPNEDITIPPEPQTTKVDVFSYGILLLEVIAKEMPTRETRYSMLQQISRRWKLMYELIVHCTKPLPSDRPTMADILNKINRIRH